MSASFEIDDTDHFCADAVGEPGRRVFYIQVRQAGTPIAFKAEKQQVAGLAEYLGSVLKDLPPVDDDLGDLALIEPVVPQWTVGNIGVAYDERTDRVVLLLTEAPVGDPEEPPPEDDVASARISLTRAQVWAYIRHAERVVSQGRPPCPICGRPQGDDHICPRSNGHGTK